MLSFFRRNEDTPELNQRREELIYQVEAIEPPEFVDFFTTSLLSDPVLTESGQVMALKSLEKWIETTQSCPITREPLSRDRLIDAKPLKEIIDTYKSNYERILQQVKTMTMTNLLACEKAVNDYSKEISQLQQRFLKLRLQLSHQVIENIKERLLLNIYDPMHLEFWREKKGCLGLGLKAVKCGQKSYWVSARAFHLLQTANPTTPFQRVSDFRKAIEKASRFRLDKCTDFWSRSTKRDVFIKNPKFMDNDLSFVIENYKLMRN